MIPYIDRFPAGAARNLNRSTHTTERSSGRKVTGGAGGTQVVAWAVFGGGHQWPGPVSAPGATGSAGHEFDAAEEICRFAQPLLVPAGARLL